MPLESWQPTQNYNLFKAIKWDEIVKLPSDAVLPYEKLDLPNNSAVKAMLDQVLHMTSCETW